MCVRVGSSCTAVLQDFEQTGCCELEQTADGYFGDKNTCNTVKDVFDELGCCCSQIYLFLFPHLLIYFSTTNLFYEAEFRLLIFFLRGNNRLEASVSNLTIVTSIADQAARRF